MIKSNDKAVFVAINTGKISRIFSQAKYGKNKTFKSCKSRIFRRLGDQIYECSKCYSRFSLKTNTYLKHRGRHWMFVTNWCRGLRMGLRQTGQQKMLSYHKSWCTDVLQS